LEVLDLSASTLTDACMRYLPRLKQLTTLFFNIQA
jgi:hypothetical protein